MAPNLKGKTALVTGGSMGIGKAVCEAFLIKGIKVCICDVNVTAGEDTLKELKSKYGEENVTFVKCDVSSEKEFEESILKAKGKFGHLDILVNNAGILNEADWEKTIDVNLKGVMRGTLLAFKHLSNSEGKKGGTVINTASVLAYQTAPITPTYCASKFGVAGWTKCWGDEMNVKRTGVRVSAVCPDATETQLFRVSAAEKSVNSEVAAAVVSAIKDTLTPADIARGFIKILEDEVSGVLLYMALNKDMVYQENVAWNAGR